MSTWPARATVLRTRVSPFVPLLRTVGFVAAVALVIFMGVDAARDVDLSSLTWWPIAVAVVLTAFWWLLLARGWALLVTGRPTREDVSIWCRTQALRYLPGGIWAPVSRGAILHGGALDRLSTVAAENVLALCAALALGGLALGLAGRIVWLPLALVVVLPLVAARWTAQRTRIEPRRTRRAQLEYLIGFAAYLAAAALDQSAVSGFHSLLLIAGAAGIAWGAGLVVVVAPSGIGVRELVYVELLAGHVPHAQAVAGALTLRVVTIVAELSMLLLAGRPPRRKT
jgi:hypothetical protein